MPASLWTKRVDVRELVALMGSLYPHPLAVDEALALAGVTDLAERKTHKLSGGQTQRVRFAVGIVADPDHVAVAGLDVDPVVQLGGEAEDAGAGGGEGVADGDRAAVHVQLVGIDLADRSAAPELDRKSVV